VKRSNSYAASIPDYQRIPKSVFAAIALSFAERLSDDGSAQNTLFREWESLHANGIVSQVPGKLGGRPKKERG
jgi:hypothetical protein